MSAFDTLSATGTCPARVHGFLGAAHDRNERRTWAVIVLCTVMMLAEIIGGVLFGSIALIADGLHMSTHASALLLAALAYSYARRHVGDARFTFGTGKLGDLAGFASAVVLAIIAMLIAYEAIARFLAPVPIRFDEAIAIATLGLLVNIASALLLGAGGHDHGHARGGAHEDADADENAPGDAHTIATGRGSLTLDIFEDGAPPRFRLASTDGMPLAAGAVSIEIERADGARQVFAMADRTRGGAVLEFRDVVPEPHAFTARIRLEGGAEVHTVAFVEHTHEHAHAHAHRDNNMRAAVVHVLADAGVSVLVIMGLLLARAFGWLWMDPAAGMIGAVVILAWSYRLVRDTGAILLDMNPDRRMEEKLRAAVESDGDRLTDLHLWRLGPGHLAAILCVATASPRGPEHYHALLRRFRDLSHVTVEVQRG